MKKEINRLKVVLAEKKRTNRWLAAQLGKNEATISKWCTNMIAAEWMYHPYHFEMYQS